MLIQVQLDRLLVPLTSCRAFHCCSALYSLYIVSKSFIDIRLTFSPIICHRFVLIQGIMMARKFLVIFLLLLAGCIVIPSVCLSSEETSALAGLITTWPELTQVPWNWDSSNLTKGCSFKGVLCSPDGHIIELSFQNFHQYTYDSAAYPFPSSFGAFPYLQLLYVEDICSLRLSPFF